LAVLVGSGEEEGVVAEETVAASEDVGNDGGVGVADVGSRVDVVDRRGEVELFGDMLAVSVYRGVGFVGVRRKNGRRQEQRQQP